MGLRIGTDLCLSKMGEEMASTLNKLSAVAFLIAVTLIGCSAAEDSLIVEAERYITLGEYRQAEATLTEAIAAYPSNDALILRRGRVRMELGDWEAAEADFSKYIERMPEDAIGYLNRASSLEKQGRIEEAEQVRNVGRSFDPYYSEFENVYSQLPSSSHEAPFEHGVDPSENSLGENGGEEGFTDFREDFLSDSSSPASLSSDSSEPPERNTGDTRWEEIDGPSPQYSTGRSIIDQILARHGGSLEEELLEENLDESEEDEMADDLAEAEEPVLTPYRWNDYLRESGYPEVVGQPPIPRSTGLNPRTVRPPGLALPPVSRSGNPTNTTPPLTTGLQSSRGSSVRRPSRTPPPAANRSSLPVERPAPPTTGIQSGSRP